jgi:release factor glutamine methyltransferase
VRALAPLPDAAPRLEAELLLAEATGWPRTRLIAWPDLMLDPDSSARFDVLLARRAAGEPMAYIRGRQAFWTLDLRVTADTLIPRPETELLVELALALPDPDRPRVVADLGTGSGAVAAALASERPGWTLVASDRSPAALRVAGRNLRTLEFRNAYPLLGDWLSPLAAGALDVILANPPYIAEGDPHLTRGDPRHEPPAALVSGPDGLDAIRAIAADAMRCLRPGGLLAVEHGCEQGAAVRALFRARGLDAPETRLDLAGHERVTLGWCATPPSPRDDPATPVRPSR